MSDEIILYVVFAKVGDRIELRAIDRTEEKAEIHRTEVDREIRKTCIPGQYCRAWIDKVLSDHLMGHGCMVAFAMHSVRRDG